MENESGKVVWITGLAGSGKTSFAVLLKQELQKRLEKSSILLDGDLIREILGKVNAHTREERVELALKYSRMAKMLSSQGFDVIVATISMFNEVYEWNRKHMPSYTEVYLKVSMEELYKRDKKGLYSGSINGSITNVAGVDLKVDYPTSHVVIANDGVSNLETLIDKYFGEIYV